MNRPEGQPGTARYGHEYESNLFPGETVKTGLTYPAILDGETLWIWRDGQWIGTPGFLQHFTPGEEWQADCDHDGLVPWKGCDTEADCMALRREDAARERAER